MLLKNGAQSCPSWFMAKWEYPPPGHITTARPVASSFFGRYTHTLAESAASPLLLGAPCGQRFTSNFCCAAVGRLMATSAAAINVLRMLILYRNNFYMPISCKYNHFIRIN